MSRKYKHIMAKLIKTDGTVTEVAPKNGRNFTLEELRTLIGCDWIEIVRLLGSGDSFLVVDEEGKLNGKERNSKATKMYGRMPYDYIVGDALLCKEGEVR